MEKNKVIQSNEFMVKESQWYNVPVLINHHQDIRNEYTNCWQINEVCSIKYKKTREEIIYRKKEHSATQSLLVFLFLKISRIRKAVM